MQVRLLSDDLLFGSKVEAMIRVAGFEPVAADGAQVALAVVDLTDAAPDDVPRALGAAQGAGEVPTLAYYSHVNDDVRRAAIEAGFTQIVPRSRMAREGADLIAALARPAAS